MRKGEPRATTQKKPVNLSNSPIVGVIESLLLTFEFFVALVTISTLCGLIFQSFQATQNFFYLFISWSLSSILIVIWMGWRNRNIFVTVRPPLKPFFGLLTLPRPDYTFFFVLLLLGKFLQAIYCSQKLMIFFKRI